MAIFVVWGLVLLAGGLALSLFAYRRMRTRPGWDRLYGPGGLLLVLGAFLTLGGVVDIAFALTS